MNKVKRKGFVVEIDLKVYGYEDYFVECTYMYDKNVEKYLLRMGLKPKYYNNRIKIEFNEIDTQYIHGTKENIESHIYRIVDQAASTGFFDRYIKQFEYECKCFEKGNELFEKEQLGSMHNE